ncbi:MAG: hypothetical protein ACOZF0_16930 [Thermodesulfobacteriota bacterium]
MKLTEISKKIPQAGLTQMGLAIKQYHEKNGNFPGKLADLYPEFIPSREFIDEIDWQYQAKGDDFLLTKTITKSQERVVVSVDKELIPRMAEEMLVATAESQNPSRKEMFEIPEPRPLLPPKPLAFGPGSEGAATESLIETPEIVSVEDGEIKPGITGGMGRSILVWKDDRGTLGFGNVIYPEDSRLSVYRNNKWITIRRPLPKSPDSEAEFSESDRSPGEREVYPGTYVWRYENGVKGFGNIALPEQEPVKIFQNDEWIDVKDLRDGEFPPLIAQTEGMAAESRQPDELAAEYSDRYLVWKDKRGHLGYGNIQYPQTREVESVCVDGNWQKVLN